MSRPVDFTGNADLQPIEGQWMDGQVSQSTAARLTFDSREGVLKIHVSGKTLVFSPQDCHFSEPLGSMPRSITFPDEARFDTSDLAGFAKLDRYLHPRSLFGLVDRLERSWRLVAISCVTCIGAVFLAYEYGIPWAAKKVAFSLPQVVLSQASKEIMGSLTLATLLKETKVDPKRREKLQKAFQDIIKVRDPNYSYELIFKDAPNIGPNAFALPSGKIVVTDQLLELTQDDREVTAVLAHEVTHVDQRHGMRMVIQNSSLFILLAGLTGDVASVTSLGASLPTLLASSNYSRNFEIEADRGAASYCLKCGWTTAPMRMMLGRLQKEHSDMDDHSPLASHPATQFRIKLLQLEDERAKAKAVP